MSSPLARLLPGPVVEFVRGCRYRGTGEHVRFLWASRRNRQAHRKLNAHLPPERLALAAGVEFSVQPEVRSTFEEFTHGNAEMVDEMHAFLRLAQGCRCLLDIGALYGAFSLAFCARTGGQAFAFEPNRLSREVLEAHARLNPGLQLNVLPFGVGEARRVVAVEAGFHFTALGPGQAPAAGLNTDQMEVVALDEFCPGRGIEPDLLKIDVEGFGHFVLLGARELLRQFRPRLLLEFHPELKAAHGHSLQATVQFLDGLGYAGYTPRLAPLDPTWLARTGNLRALFIPRERPRPW